MDVYNRRYIPKQSLHMIDRDYLNKDYRDDVYSYMNHSEPSFHSRPMIRDEYPEGSFHSRSHSEGNVHLRSFMRDNYNAPYISSSSSDNDMRGPERRSDYYQSQRPYNTLPVKRSYQKHHGRGYENRLINSDNIYKNHPSNGNMYPQEWETEYHHMQNMPTKRERYPDGLYYGPQPGRRPKESIQTPLTHRVPYVEPSYQDRRYYAYEQLDYDYDSEIADDPGILDTPNLCSDYGDIYDESDATSTYFLDVPDDSSSIRSSTAGRNPYGSEVEHKIEDSRHLGIHENADPLSPIAEERNILYHNPSSDRLQRPPPDRVQNTVNRDRKIQTEIEFSRERSARRRQDERARPTSPSLHNIPRSAYEAARESSSYEAPSRFDMYMVERLARFEDNINMRSLPRNLSSGHKYRQPRNGPNLQRSTSVDGFRVDLKDYRLDKDDSLSRGAYENVISLGQLPDSSLSRRDGLLRPAQGFRSDLSLSPNFDRQRVNISPRSAASTGNLISDNFSHVSVQHARRRFKNVIVGSFTYPNSFDSLSEQEQNERMKYDASDRGQPKGSYVKSNLQGMPEDRKEITIRDQYFDRSQRLNEVVNMMQKQDNRTRPNTHVFWDDTLNRDPGLVDNHNKDNSEVILDEVEDNNRDSDRAMTEDEEDSDSEMKRALVQKSINKRTTAKTNRAGLNENETNCNNRFSESVTQSEGRDNQKNIRDRGPDGRKQDEGDCENEKIKDKEKEKLTVTNQMENGQGNVNKDKRKLTAETEGSLLEDNIDMDIRKIGETIRPCQKLCQGNHEDKVVDDERNRCTDGNEVKKQEGIAKENKRTSKLNENVASTVLDVQNRKISPCNVTSREDQSDFLDSTKPKIAEKKGHEEAKVATIQRKNADIIEPEDVKRRPVSQIVSSLEDQSKRKLINEAISQEDEMKKSIRKKKAEKEKEQTDMKGNRMIAKNSEDESERKSDDSETSDENNKPDLMKTSVIGKRAKREDDIKDKHEAAESKEKHKNLDYEMKRQSEHSEISDEDEKINVIRQLIRKKKARGDTKVSETEEIMPEKIEGEIEKKKSITNKILENEESSDENHKIDVARKMSKEKGTNRESNHLEAVVGKQEEHQEDKEKPKVRRKSEIKGVSNEDEKVDEKGMLNRRKKSDNDNRIMETHKVGSNKINGGGGSNRTSFKEARIEIQKMLERRLSMNANSVESSLKARIAPDKPKEGKTSNIKTKGQLSDLSEDEKPKKGSLSLGKKHIEGRQDSGLINDNDRSDSTNKKHSEKSSRRKSRDSAEFEGQDDSFTRTRKSSNRSSKRDSLKQDGNITSSDLVGIKQDNSLPGSRKSSNRSSKRNSLQDVPQKANLTSSDSIDIKQDNSLTKTRKYSNRSSKRDSLKGIAQDDNLKSSDSVGMKQERKNSKGTKRNSKEIVTKSNSNNRKPVTVEVKIRTKKDMKEQESRKISEASQNTDQIKNTETSSDIQKQNMASAAASKGKTGAPAALKEKPTSPIVSKDQRIAVRTQTSNRKISITQSNAPNQNTLLRKLSINKNKENNDIKREMEDKQIKKMTTIDKDVLEKEDKLEEKSKKGGLKGLLTRKNAGKKGKEESSESGKKTAADLQENSTQKRGFFNRKKLKPDLSKNVVQNDKEKLLNAKKNTLLEKEISQISSKEKQKIKSTDLSLSNLQTDRNNTVDNSEPLLNKESDSLSVGKQIKIKLEMKKGSTNKTEGSRENNIKSNEHLEQVRRNEAVDNSGENDKQANVFEKLGQINSLSERGLDSVERNTNSSMKKGQTEGRRSISSRRSHAKTESTCTEDSFEEEEDYDYIEEDSTDQEESETEDDSDRNFSRTGSEEEEDETESESEETTEEESSEEEESSFESEEDEESVYETDTEEDEDSDVTSEESAEESETEDDEEEEDSDQSETETESDEQSEEEKIRGHTRGTGIKGGSRRK